MRTLELTDKEYEMIKKMREKKEIPQEKLQKAIDKYLKAYKECEQTTFKLKEYVSSSSKAANYIFSKIDGVAFKDLYDYFEAEKNGWGEDY